VFRQLFGTGVIVCCLWAAFLPAQPPEQTAWEILQAGVESDKADQRAAAVHVLGLLQLQPRARQLADKGLLDNDSRVRAAAATALGQMGAKESIPRLREALRGEDSEVVFAAADALYRLGDESAYEVYYAVLMGERKSGQSLMERQEKMIKDPKALARLGLEGGLGFIPFGSIGYGAVRALRRDDVSPVRAAAAQRLIRDADPKSAQALVKCVADEKWIVRAAVAEAIAKREDPTLLEAVLPLLTDENRTVCFSAAAAVIRLSGAKHRK